MRGVCGSAALPAVILLVVCALFGSSPATAGAATNHPGTSCQATTVPVSVPLVGNASIYGELCVPDGGASTVQLLVHGGTYNHNYLDWPLDPNRYSYARKALNAGYATFSVDRLGYGQSTHPLSALNTFENGAEAIHQVIGKLRSGTIGGHAFSRVVWVGHSMGSITAWLEAKRYSDVDAFVLTGLLHTLKPTFLATFAVSSYPALLDPKFAGAGLDPGYLTTRPGTRGSLLYYAPNVDQSVIDEDERLKDVVSEIEPTEAEVLLNAPPLLSPSRSITVPTLLAVGDRDNIFCGPPDGLDCTSASLQNHEGPYYQPAAQLDVFIAPDSGHDLQLQRNAPSSNDAIIDWIDALD